MARVLLSLLCMAMTAGCAARLSQMKASQRSELLAAERGKLYDLKDPVDRTRSYIKISDILLTFASDGITDGATGEVKVFLDQYVMAIQSARDTMVMSKRDAERRPAGYKDLEIAIRAQLRILQDLGGRLVVEDRKPVEDAMATATSIRNEMLRMLFPQSSRSA